VEIDIQVAKEAASGASTAHQRHHRAADRLPGELQTGSRYFMDPVQPSPVPDLRYLPPTPAAPAVAIGGRMLAGPSAALAGAR